MKYIRIVVRIFKIVFCLSLVYIVLVIYFNNAEIKQFKSTSINSSFKEITKLWGKPMEIYKWEGSETFTVKYNNEWFGLNRIYFKFNVNDSLLIEKYSDN